MAETEEVTEVKVNPVGRPAKKVRITLVLDESFGITDPRIDVEAKKADGLVADVKKNGYTFTKAGYVKTIMPSYIKMITKKEL